MNVSDLIVEVRDRDLVRVAQFTEADLAGLTFVIRANSVGSWEAVLPATLLDSTGARTPNPVAEALREEGSGVVIQAGSSTLLSGPMTAARFDATADDADGVWTISGVSDAVLLADALAYPQPSNANPATQSVANDTRTGLAEDLLRQYVSLNIANGAVALPPTSWAPAGRLAGLRSKLRLQGPSLGRGPSLTRSPRFENLLELCQSIAAQGGLRFDVVQVGALLEFVVTTPTDRSALVQMDVENEQLASVAFGVGSPATTVALVAGQGEGTDREIVQVTSSESLAAETSWGRRIERFVDQRQAELTAELTQKGGEIIAAEGATVASVKAAPSDDLVDVFMTDWRVGDYVSVVVRDVPLVVPVVEAAIRVSEQGLLVGATLGDPTGFDPEDLAFSRQSTTEARVSSLERNAEPPTWDTLDGKPSTFPSTWAEVSGKPTTFTPSTHTHAAGDITSGALPIARGGTGGATAAAARTALGVAAPGDAGIPFRMAAGIAATTATFPTFTLPAGRFTESPIITAQLISGAGADIGVVIMVTNVTTTSFQARHTAASGTKNAAWIAVQMTSAAAAG